MSVDMKKVLFYLVSLLFITGCSMNTLDNASTKGSLILQLSNELTRTVEPDFDMTIASYDIDGYLSETESFSVTGLTDSTIVKNELSIGSWTISVTAKNEAGTTIGTGSTTCLIADGEVTEAEVILSIEEGLGDLYCCITWPEDRISDPNINAVLTTSDLEASDPDFDIVSNVASQRIYDLESGYYILNFKLYDGSTYMYGFVEAIRIIKDQETSLTIELTLDDLNLEELPVTGDLNLSINSSEVNPITIDNTGYLETLILGNGMTITIAPSITPDSYKWYLNGDVLTDETTDTLTIGSDFELGSYRLDCVVQQDNLISSESFPFSVNEDYIVGGRGEAQGWVFYDKGSYSDGWRFIEAAYEDLADKMVVGTYSYDFTEDLPKDIGSGQSNTSIIDSNDPTRINAADSCYHYCKVINGTYYEDWFLPSYDELTEIYNNLYLNNIGNFKASNYWTSSAYQSSTVDKMYYRNFSTGENNTHGYKNYTMYVRPVRYF